MKLKNYIFFILFCCLAVCLPESSLARDNVFKRGAEAVRGFFKNENASENVSAPDAVTDGNDGVPPATTTPVLKFSTPEEELKLLYDFSLDENIRIPALGKRAAEIKEYQRVQARKLVAAGEAVETMRGGEVIIATVPNDELFFPNDTVLKPTAGKYLRPYAGFLKKKDMYRMLLAMHSDDTGSESYTDALTSRRVLAVLDWFQRNAENSEYVIPYAMGASEPLFKNNSVSNRENNRRLEIYLVPGRAMIKAASDSLLGD